MVKAIIDVEKTLGDWIKKPTKGEKEIKKVAMRSVVAKVDISEGTFITGDMLDVKRPGTGIVPKYMREIIGKRVKSHINKDELIYWGAIE